MNNIDKTKWIVRTNTRWLPGASGYYEIIAAFELKGEAEHWVRQAMGRNWRRSYEVVRRQA